MATIHLLFGPLGAGKSTLAKRLTQEKRAICFSIDQWMQQLYGADRPDQLSMAWVLPRVERCETQIWLTALAILQTELDVVLDLGFMTLAKRQHFRALASEAGYEVANYFVNADKQTRYDRVMQRNLTKGDTYSFEISSALFHFMDAAFEAPNDQELKICQYDQTY